MPRAASPSAIADDSMLTQLEAAEKMGMSQNRLNEIARGKRGITADTALRLTKLFKTTPEFWMNLQNACDLYEAKQATRASA
jgi:addiction module HigA family antidote